MARTRNIKPGFFKNDELAECSLAARLLFAGLWCIADKAGRLEYRPKRIKADVMPFDNVDVDELVTELANRTFLAVYLHGNCKYLQILNFEKHQRPHPKEPDSVIPAMPCNYTAEQDFSTAEQDKKTEGCAFPSSNLTVLHSSNPSLSQSDNRPLDVAEKEYSTDRRSLEFIHDAIDMELATEFFQSVQAIIPNSKFPVLVEWAAEFRSMRTKDPPDRTPENIREMLTWVHQDSFWKQAVLTPMSLRKNWDAITIRRSSHKELNAITDGI